MRVAYVTPHDCGLGHAVRGIALVRAARGTAVTLRAFGPPKDAATEYEGSADWPDRVADFAPDLLLGDFGWPRLRALRQSLGAPSWLLMKWMQPGYLYGAAEDGWERVISVEPSADDMPGVTDRVPPILDPDYVYEPVDGEPVAAGYHRYWQATWRGYRDRVRWIDEPRMLDRAARLAYGGEMTVNGADVLVAQLAACRRCGRAVGAHPVWTFDPGLHGADYKADDHGFAPVHPGCMQQNAPGPAQGPGGV